MRSSIKNVIDKNLFEVMYLEHLSQEEKDNLFQKAYETVMNRVLLRVADQLSEQELEDFQAVVEEKDHDAIHSFLKEKNIDIDEIASQEALAYKVEMASLAQTLRKRDHES